MGTKVNTQVLADLLAEKAGISKHTTPIMTSQEYVDQFMADIVKKNPNEKEFHQAVREVVESVADYIVESPQLMKMKVLERIAEPERVIMFRTLLLGAGDLFLIYSLTTVLCQGIQLPVQILVSGGASCISYQHSLKR